MAVEKRNNAKTASNKSCDPCVYIFCWKRSKTHCRDFTGGPWKIWDECGIPPATLYGAAEGMQTGRIRGGDSAGQDAGRKGRPA